MAGYIDPTKQAFAAFRADDRPGPVHMLNLVRLRAEAEYPDRRVVSGEQAYAAYGRADSRLIRLAPLPAGKSFGARSAEAST